MMRSTSTCTLLFLLTFISTMEAQHCALQPEAELDRNYQTCVDYNKKTEWKEIDCSRVKQSDNRLSKTDILRYEQEFQKMKQYQERLIALGYNLKVTGTADDKTLKAYRKYLRRWHLLS